MESIFDRFSFSTESLLVYSPKDGSRDRLATLQEEKLYQEIVALRTQVEASQKSEISLTLSLHDALKRIEAAEKRAEDFKVALDREMQERDIMMARAMDIERVATKERMDYKVKAAEASRDAAQSRIGMLREAWFAATGGCAQWDLGYPSSCNRGKDANDCKSYPMCDALIATAADAKKWMAEQKAKTLSEGAKIAHKRQGQCPHCHIAKQIVNELEIRAAALRAGEGK